MKKLSLLLAAGICGSVAFGQTEAVKLESKRGVSILPEAGEYSIGIGASPFLSFLGNAFNNNNFNGDPNWTAPNSPFQLGGGSLNVSGKRMNTASDAYRVRFQLAHNQQGFGRQVLRDTLTPDLNNPIYGEDVQKTSNSYVALALGKEWRRGKSRVQGVFGGEGFFEFGSSSSSYVYQNAITQDFVSPTTFNFGNNLLSGSAIRVLERKSGAAFGIGVRGFAGVEYFIAPRLSLGAEFGYALRFQHTSTGSIQTERLDATTLQRVTQTVDGVNRFNNFSLGLDNLSGVINLQFYF